MPFRGLAEKGVIHDASPYSLDLSAWSGGSNVRFHAGKAMRAPIWRTVTSLPFRPQHCVALRPSSGFDSVFLAGEDGLLWQYISGSINAVSAAAYVPVVDPRSFTSCYLGDVLYINRPSGQPYYFGPSSTVFATLPGWNATWTCRALRTFGNYVVALGLVEGANIIRGGIHWSDLALVGQPPASWDFTNPSINAGENVLEGLTSPIVDGMTMRSIFVIYSGDQVWSMVQTGQQDIFRFSKMFNEGGMIAPNCAVEVDGKHYVFGPNDIYVHDATSKQSIIDQRNRDYVYRNINMKASEACFVSFNPALNEVTFNYQTADADAAFLIADRCNKSAVYNIAANVWSFADLPNVSATTVANLNTQLTYASSAGLTYGTVGGSYADQDSGFGQNTVAISTVLTGKITANRLLAYDYMNKGKVALPYLAEVNAPAVLERVGLSLDSVGSDLTTYKNVRRVYPQLTMYGDVPVLIEIGGSLTPTGPVKWAPAVSFNPVTQYKVDIQQGGRYLAVRFTVPQPADFEVQGFDLDVSPGGRR